MEDCHCFELAKTAMLRADPVWFDDQIVNELKYNYVRKYDKVACRLNGGSDLDWTGVAARVPEVQFMDYTKVPQRMFDWIDGELPPNYHLTFSRGSHNWLTCLEVLRRGGNVSVVVHKKPSRYKNDRVFHLPIRSGSDGLMLRGSYIDGDTNALRFLDVDNRPCVDGRWKPNEDRCGNIVMLSAKGHPAKADHESGFVLESLYDLDFRAIAS